jgi:hypothetical protein
VRRGGGGGTASDWPRKWESIMGDGRMAIKLVLGCINKRYMGRRVPSRGSIANLCNQVLATPRAPDWPRRAGSVQARMAALRRLRSLGHWAWSKPSSSVASFSLANCPSSGDGQFEAAAARDRNRDVTLGGRHSGRGDDHNSQRFVRVAGDGVRGPRPGGLLGVVSAGLVRPEHFW